MMNLLCIKFDSNIELTSLLTTLLSVMVVVLGWMYNQAQNRKNEIVKEARTHRLEMLKSFMKIFRLMEETNNFIRPSEPDEEGECEHFIPDDMSLWTEVYVQIKIYGENDEIKLYKEIIYALDNALFDPGERRLTNKNFHELYEKCEKMSNICANRIRKELHLRQIKW
jgi:hypothetical protein